MNTLDRVVLYSVAGVLGYIAWKLYPLGKLSGAADTISDITTRVGSIFSAIGGK